MDMASAPALAKQAFTPVSLNGAGADAEVQFVPREESAAPHFVAAWESLGRCASEPNPFFEPWFLRPSLEHFGQRKGIKLLAYYVDGTLRGLLPLRRTWDYYGYPVPHLSVWLHDNAFCGAPLVAAGHEHNFWRAIIAQCQRGLGLELFLHLPMLDAKGPLNAALGDVLNRTGRPQATVRDGERAMLSSHLSADDYLHQSISGKKRKELRRQYNRLAERGNLTFERADCSQNIEPWIREFLALEAAGWKGGVGSALANAADTSSFFQDTLLQAADAGRLERLTLRLDGKPIAMLANFLVPPGAFSFKTTYDERFSQYSPGMLLQLENLALLDRTDIAWADSCAVEGHPMIERLWREKRRMVSHNLPLGSRLRSTLFNQLMRWETRRRSNA